MESSQDQAIILMTNISFLPRKMTSKLLLISVICCLLLLRRYSCSQTASIVNFHEIEVLFPDPAFTIYFLVLDHDFFDFSKSNFPVVIDDLLDRKMTGHAMKLNLKFTHFSLKQLPGIVVLGSEPWERTVGLNKFMCGAWHGDGSLEAPHLLKCPYALSENVMILVDHTVTKSINFDTQDYKALGRYSHVLLFLFYEDGGLEDGYAICLYCNQSQAVTTDLTYNKTVFSSGSVQKVDYNDIFKRYQRQLVVPAECADWLIIGKSHEPVEKPSPFHSSWSPALDTLQCRSSGSEELQEQISVLTSLVSEQGSYPAYSDLILQPHSRPYLIISSDNVVVLGSGQNPYTSPFDTATWLLVGATLLTFVMAATVASLWIRKEKRLFENIATALFTTYGILLDQINGNIAQVSKGSLAMRLLLLSLTLPAILLTNFYRSALQSEFTVQTETYLDIDSSEDLLGYKVYLIFDGEQCKSLKQNLLTTKNQVKEAIWATCPWNDHDNRPGCTFFNQAAMASMWLNIWQDSNGSRYNRVKLEKMDSIFTNTSYACVSDISQIVKSRGSEVGTKRVFMVSQTLGPAAWVEFAKLMKEDPSRVFAYKKDSEDSFFMRPRGFMIPLHLGPHQVWVRKKLRALSSSGITRLWSKWVRITLDRNTEKMWETYTEESRKPTGISLKQSWISVFISVCGWSLAAATVVFRLELG